MKSVIFVVGAVFVASFFLPVIDAAPLAEVKGHDAAELVFDILRNANRSDVPKHDKDFLEILLLNLANPLFVVGAILLLAGANKPGALCATGASVSALWWLGSGDLVKELMIGYWAWAGACVLLAIVGWMAAANE